MKLSQGVAAVVLSVAAVAAHAEVTATVTAVSDYDFRGITQTAKDPALQASIDYSHASGFYAGAWFSNVDFGGCCDENIEMDLYTGWRGSFDPMSYDLGIVYYTYPGADSINFPEIYASATWKILTGKLWYSWDFGNSNKSAEYYQLDANLPLPSNFAASAHVGYSDGDYWDSVNNGGYTDWSVGVTYTWGQFTLGLKYVDGSDLPDLDNFCHDFPSECGKGFNKDVGSTDPRAIFSISTTFPWKKE